MSRSASRVIGLSATVLALLVMVFAQAGVVQGMSGPVGQGSVHHSLGLSVPADQMQAKSAATTHAKSAATTHAKSAATTHAHSSPVPYQAAGSHDRSVSPVSGTVADCMISCYAMLVPPEFSAPLGTLRIASHIDSVDLLRARPVLPHPEPPKTRS